MDGLISNEAFINNADSNSSSSSSNDPLGVLLEAPLGAYWHLKSYNQRHLFLFFITNTYVLLQVDRWFWKFLRKVHGTK